MMNWRLGLMAVWLVSLAGCVNIGGITVTNKGPFPIQVTSNPTPNAPALPITIQPRATGNILEYLYFEGTTLTVVVQAVDTVDNNNQTLQVVLPDGYPIVRLTWDGTTLTQNPP